MPYMLSTYQCHARSRGTLLFLAKFGIFSYFREHDRLLSHDVPCNLTLASL